MDATDGTPEALAEAVLELPGVEASRVLPPPPFRAACATFGAFIGGGAHDATGCGVAGVLGVQGCDRVPLAPATAVPHRGVPGAATRQTLLGRCRALPSEPSYVLPLTSGGTGAGGAAIPLPERLDDGAGGLKVDWTRAAGGAT